MPTSTLNYIDKVVSTYNSGSDSAGFSKLDISDTATMVGADIKNLSVKEVFKLTNLAGNKTINFPDADDIPTSALAEAHYLAYEPIDGSLGNITIKKFEDGGFTMSKLASVIDYGSGSQGMLTTFSTDAGGKLVISQDSEYNAFSGRTEILADKLKMTDNILVASNPPGSGAGVYRLTLGNLVASVQILASEITTIGSLTSNTKATSAHNSIDFTVDEMDTYGYNPTMKFDIDGLSTAAGHFSVPTTHGFTFGAPFEITGDTTRKYYNGVISYIDEIESSGVITQYSGFVFETGDYATEQTKTLSLEFETATSVILTNDVTQIGQDIILTNSEIDLLNSNLNFANNTIIFDDGSNLAVSGDLVLTQSLDDNSTLWVQSLTTSDFVRANNEFRLGEDPNQFRMINEAAGTRIQTTAANTIYIDSPVSLSDNLSSTGTVDLTSASSTTFGDFSAQVASVDSVSSTGDISSETNFVLPLNGQIKIVNGATTSYLDDTQLSLPNGYIACGEDITAGNGLLVQAGGVQIVAGGVQIDAGGLNIDDGDLTCGTCEFERSTGTVKGTALAIGAGDFQLQSSAFIQDNLTVVQGDLAVTAGALTMGAGNIILNDGSTVTSSSRMLKENISEYKRGLSAIMNMKPVTYNRKTKPGTQEFGFIAEEMEKVLPTVVSSPNDIKSIKYTEIIPVLVSALQEQQQKINELESKLSK